MTKDELLKILNQNLADLAVINVKLHNYHWNVKGINFKPIHEMTEAYYNYFNEQYDEVAERIVQLAGKPLASLKDYLDNATLKEEMKNEFDGKTVLQIVLADFEKLNVEFKRIAEAADELDDSTTAALAEDNIAWLEKEIWMVKATLA
ncbi:MAG: DNA starvation/stationary phase protection protein [Melioribacteraceae bacterium]|nr:DNA starvation/stationary phase protection protein [Melioribacteraceae bacterium]